MLTGHADNLRGAFLHPDNLSLAWRRVRKNKAGPGIDGVTWETFDTYAEEFLTALRTELSRGTYRPSPLLGALRRKRSGGWRPLGIPTHRDRVAQRALLNVIGLRLEREMESCSFAYREGRSIFQALARVEQHRDKGLTFVVDADIDDCFDSLDHELLLACLAQYVDEQWVLDLVAGWIKAPVVFRGQRYERERGVPQGAVISPVLCNLFLDELDEALLARRFALVRYADDFVVLASREERAYEALDLTSQALGSLDLRLEESKTRVTSFAEGFEYLGVIFVGSLAVPTFNLALPAQGGSARFVGGYPEDLPRSAWSPGTKREYRALLKRLSGKRKPKQPTALEVALWEAVKELRAEERADPPLWLPSALIT
jgi:group II intron reverse transcriptase/maturase